MKCLIQTHPKRHTLMTFSLRATVQRGEYSFVCPWLMLCCTEAMSIFPPCSIKVELYGLWRDLPSHATTDPVQTLHSRGAFWPRPDTFRMWYESSETSLLISPTPKHLDTHICKDVPLNTSRLIKTDSWITVSLCLCLAVRNRRLPRLVLMCKLRSSQADSCYRLGIKTQRRWCESCRAPWWN